MGIRLLFFFSLALVLHFTAGHYFLIPFEIFLATCVFALAGSLFNWHWKVPPAGRWLVILLFLFCFLLVADNHLMYAIYKEAWKARHCFKTAVFFAALALLNVFLEGRGPFSLRRGLYCVWVVIFCLALGKFLVLRVSPSPHIDVFTSCTQAVKYFLEGKPVYSGVYEDIYQGAYGPHAGAYVYLPVILYVTTLSYKLFGDIRVGFVLADLLTLLVIWRIGKALSLDSYRRWLFVAVWAAFPLTPFVLEQSWNEPLLVLFLAGLLLAMIRGRWVWAGACLAVLMGTKQYSIFLVLMTLTWAWVYRGKKQAMGMAMVSALGFALLVLPFAVSDPNGFYENIFVVLAKLPVRKDSLSVTALALQEFHVVISPLVRISFYVASLLLGMWAILRRPDYSRWAVVCGFVYLGIFLMGKQAFCNYYWFTAFFFYLDLLLGETQRASL